MSIINLPLVSICIPAYKNITFLERLLKSLLAQTFSNFEVIISDDSPDDSVKNFIGQYNVKLTIAYFKNTPSLGTPANWNFAMNQAKGDFIKLIHDDDWLASPDALQLMVDALANNKQVDFLFGAFNNVDVETNTVETVFAKKNRIDLIKKNPLHLFRKNIIGPPSVIMHRRSFSFNYDEKLKWVVDFEAYISVLKQKTQFIYINQPLINVGISSLQVTKTTSRIREVEIPENLYVLNKHGLEILNNIWVYDYYWRLLRNVSIRKEEDIMNAGWDTQIPSPLKRMLQWQQYLPLALLKFGPLSKFLMFLCFITRSK